jgi:hypothetical protein
MKTIISLIMVLAVNANAGFLTLDNGETAVIRANRDTTVTCGNGGGSEICDRGAVETLKTLVDACATGSNKAYCMNQYWPNFKKGNPGCVNATLNMCIDYCASGSNRAYCAQECIK